MNSLMTREHYTVDINENCTFLFFHFRTFFPFPFFPPEGCEGPSPQTWFWWKWNLIDLGGQPSVGELLDLWLALKTTDGECDEDDEESSPGAWLTLDTDKRADDKASRECPGCKIVCIVTLAITKVCLMRKEKTAKPDETNKLQRSSTNLGKEVHILHIVHTEQCYQNKVDSTAA